MWPFGKKRFPVESMDEAFWNNDHRPSRIVAELHLPPRMLLVWRPARPGERQKGGGLIVVPASARQKYSPSCALILKAGRGCRGKPGQYVHWISDGMDEHKPHRLVFQHTNEEPTFFIFHEQYAVGFSEAAAVADRQAEVAITSEPVEDDLEKIESM